MMDPVIDVPGHGARLLAFADMLRGLEIPVPVVPGEQHVLAKSFAGHGTGQAHGLAIIRWRRLGRERDLCDTAQIRWSR